MQTFNELVMVPESTTIKNMLESLAAPEQIKSTGDGIACKQLFEKYTTHPVTIDMARQYHRYLTEKRTKLLGNRKLRSRLFYNYVPIFGDNGIVDVKMDRDIKDVFEQNKLYKKLMMSTKFHE